ncbi:MAG: hypothetical protein KAR05_10485 [Candidatus Omnitrophica bacterium]|nr:hypothetical protein [Candidatus Omnitrophota bacterium]
MRTKNVFITLCIHVILLALVSSALAGDISRSFKINVYIPVMPGLNAPEDGSLLMKENATSEEMITTTEEFFYDEQKIILRTIVPK